MKNQPALLDPPQIWFAIKYDDTIEPIKVYRITAQRIYTKSEPTPWDKNPQLRIRSQDETFPTWSEAHDYLLAKLHKEAGCAKERLERTEARLARALAVTPPQP